MKNYKVFFIISFLAIGSISGGYWFFQEIKKPIEFKLSPIQEKEIKDIFPLETENKKSLMIKNKENDFELENPSKSLQKQDKKEEEKNITLSAKEMEGKIELSWTLSSNVEILHGFKIVRSTIENPRYPEDNSRDISDSAMRNYIWKSSSEKIYHFRVCAYDGKNGCFLYSNNVSAKILKTKKGEDIFDYASEINLSAKKKNGDIVELAWEISSGKAPKGFKIVRSTIENPRYPEDESRNIDNSKSRKYEWKDNYKKGICYHFRICVFEGEKCGVYSDNVAVNF